MIVGYAVHVIVNFSGRVKCPGHNSNRFEVVTECLYAGYMKVAATAVNSVDFCTQNNFISTR